MDESREQPRHASFCRICGNRLMDDSMYCSRCGTKAVACEPTDPAPVDAPPKKGARKCILLSCLGIALLAAVVFGLIRFMPEKVKTQDINLVNGCPEFFNLEFGMSSAQAFEQIDDKDIAQNTMVTYDRLFLPSDSSYRLYGLPVLDVYCSFEQLKLDHVMIVFSKDEVSLEEVLALYQKIYGPTSNTHIWIGKKTIIDVVDDKEENGMAQKIIVHYSMSRNDRYPMFSFDGTEIDPCGFLSDNWAFNKPISNYISHLTEGEDYFLREYSASGFSEPSHYSLYPVFEYMGIDPYRTSIRLTAEGKDQCVTLVEYVFLADADQASEKIKYMYKKLSDTYGVYEDCTRASMLASELGAEDISFDEFCKKVEDRTQGMYNIQWISDGKRITLNLTVEPEEKSYIGSVSFALVTAE